MEKDILLDENANKSILKIVLDEEGDFVEFEEKVDA